MLSSPLTGLTLWVDQIPYSRFAATLSPAIDWCRCGNRAVAFWKLRVIEGTAGTVWNDRVGAFLHHDSISGAPTPHEWDKKLDWPALYLPSPIRKQLVRLEESVKTRNEVLEELWRAYPPKRRGDRRYLHVCSATSRLPILVTRNFALRLDLHFHPCGRKKTPIEVERYALNSVVPNPIPARGCRFTRVEQPVVGTVPIALYDAEFAALKRLAPGMSVRWDVRYSAFRYFLESANLPTPWVQDYSLVRGEDVYYFAARPAESVSEYPAIPEGTRDAFFKLGNLDLRLQAAVQVTNGMLNLMR